MWVGDPGGEWGIREVLVVAIRVVVGMVVVVIGLPRVNAASGP